MCVQEVERKRRRRSQTEEREVREKQTSLPSTVEHWKAPPLTVTRPFNWLTGWVGKGSSYLATEAWLVSIRAQTYRGMGG